MLGGLLLGVVEAMGAGYIGEFTDLCNRQPWLAGLIDRALRRRGQLRALRQQLPGRLRVRGADRSCSCSGRPGLLGERVGRPRVMRGLRMATWFQDFKQRRLPPRCGHPARHGLRCWCCPSPSRRPAPRGSGSLNLRDPVRAARPRTEHRGRVSRGCSIWATSRSTASARTATRCSRRPTSVCHLPFWVILPIGAALVACLLGVVLGAPTLKLRGDYLAIVTLGFGEIIRIVLNNLWRSRSTSPMGLSGITLIEPFSHRRLRASAKAESLVRAHLVSGPIKYYYLLLVVLDRRDGGECAAAGLAHRPRVGRDPRGRDGGAARWASTRGT
jgi:hypothetical protein